MKILVISDIHANITALETVLDAAGNVNEVWCLGDLVGYGPDPNECIEKIQSLDHLSCILGNHDLAVLQEIESNAFNPEARNTIQWTRSILSKENKAFLRNLQEEVIIGDVTLCHGSPRHPIWEYLMDPITASINFSYFDTSLCFVGHTHFPSIFTLTYNANSASLAVPEPNKQYTIAARTILNPGSVGQPRDRDPRTSYAIYDDEAKTWENFRVEYDFRTVQQRMWAAGLPQRHISRLEAGW